MADVTSTPGQAMELITAAVQKELQFKAKLAGMITDVSQFALPGHDSITFPKLTSFTVVDRVAGVAGDATALTDTSDTLDLDFNAYVAWIIDSMSEIQTRIDVQIENARRAASAQARFVDTKIIAEAETVGVATTTIAAVITRDVVLEMRRSMRENDADLDLASYWVSPAQEEALLKIDEFTRADAYGSSNIPTGVIGRLFGIPVLIHNDLADAQYFLVEKSGMALGFQKGISMDEQGANEFGVGAVRKAMDQLFGVQGLQLGEKGVAGTESPLVIKDNN
jgi:hypothetical protein